MHSMKQWLNRRAARSLALLIAWTACLGMAPACSQAAASAPMQARADLFASAAPAESTVLCPVDPAVNSASPPASGTWPCFDFQVSWTVTPPSPVVDVAVSSGTTTPQTQALPLGGHWYVPGLSKPLQMDVVSQQDNQGCPIAVLRAMVQTSPSGGIIRNIARWSVSPSPCGSAQRAQP